MWIDARRQVRKQIRREQPALAASRGHVARECMNEDTDARCSSKFRPLRHDSRDHSGENVTHPR
jgi:hypothetical protein